LPELPVSLPTLPEPPPLPLPPHREASGVVPGLVRVPPSVVRPSEPSGRRVRRPALPGRPVVLRIELPGGLSLLPFVSPARLPGIRGRLCVLRPEFPVLSGGVRHGSQPGQLVPLPVSCERLRRRP